MVYIVLILAVAFFAYSNGANDNFKGVATLYGSRQVSYKTAVAWATATTLMGSIASIFLAAALVKNFSGKGLVPDVFVNDPSFAVSVAVGAAMTVFVATKIGMPISSTHAMVGALFGTGFIVSGGDVKFELLLGVFLIPLILSPVLSAFCSAVLIKAQSLLSSRDKNCICITDSKIALESGPRNYFFDSKQLTFANIQDCQKNNLQNGVTFNSSKTIDSLHFLSSGTVCFARGLNDTPKIVALLILIPWLQVYQGLLLIAILMAVGGLLHSRKISRTMGDKISLMSRQQGFISNLITSFFVISASLFGLPVSTTHVSVGAISGMGIANKSVDFKVLKHILLSWVLTLPCGALISFLVYLFISNL
ncbi:inorganic phosphate transporter [Belliella sp. R4-6]|uniref:Phosphate transporter n=1 Tax=Belliella alkalica TaxID=1730871 RepID=A0ABS9V986_9BACT|nr:inorganic phosphate transporter [Belliella alkalica]MCH7412508.1 inorganic phosphate transporter [Belliella alkalica]